MAGFVLVQQAALLNAEFYSPLLLEKTMVLKGMKQFPAQCSIDKFANLLVILTN
jgi:hypothetical protein